MKVYESYDILEWADSVGSYNCEVIQEHLTQYTWDGVSTHYLDDLEFCLTDDEPEYDIEMSQFLIDFMKAHKVKTLNIIE